MHKEQKEDKIWNEGKQKVLNQANLLQGKKDRGIPEGTVPDRELF